MYRHSILLIFSFIFCLHVSAQDFYIKDFDVDIVMKEDGSFDVTEQIQVYFTERSRGIIRKIPTKYELENGERHSIRLENENVERWKHKVYNERGDRVIRIGDANRYISGDQEYVIHYTVEGAISKYADHDEFYWNITGDEWVVPIERAGFTFEYPSAWTNNITEYLAYAGRKGSRNQMTTLTKSENRISGTAINALSPYSGISLAVKIPSGLITQPEKREIMANDGPKEAIQQTSKWISAIPASLAALLFWFWRNFGRRPKESEAVNDQYFPPQGFSPAEVGTFYDFRVNRRDIISLLPFWGNLGLLRVKPIGENDDMYFKKLKPFPSDRPEFERAYFDELFKDGDLILLSDLKNSFYTTMSSVASRIKKDILKKKLYDEQARKWFHSGWLILAFFSLLAVGILTIVFWKSIVAGVGFILLGVGAFIVHFLAPKHSDKGVVLHRHLRGLYNFLKDPEEQKLNELLKEDPQYLNKMFPYALAFGLDKSWTEKLDNIYTPPPTWYDYSVVYGPQYNNSYGHFTKSFQPHKIEKVFYSAPVSTGGSASGGFSGGSVGGGFGGGGGSSW